jgi:hypothetical protein
MWCRYRVTLGLYPCESADPKEPVLAGNRVQTAQLHEQCAGPCQAELF